MKQKIIISLYVICIISISVICYNNKVYAAKDKIIKNETESKLVELNEKELKSREDFENVYGSKTYGLTAYILHKVRIFSIPFCFLGILAGAVYDYVIGIRHLEVKEKGLALIISFITIGVICQVLPLVFTIVVRFGRE